MQGLQISKKARYRDWLVGTLGQSSRTSSPWGHAFLGIRSSGGRFPPSSYHPALTPRCALVPDFLRLLLLPAVNNVFPVPKQSSSGPLHLPRSDEPHVRFQNSSSSRESRVSKGSSPHYHAISGSSTRREALVSTLAQSDSLAIQILRKPELRAEHLIATTGMPSSISSILRYPLPGRQDCQTCTEFTPQSGSADALQQTSNRLYNHPHSYRYYQFVMSIVFYDHTRQPRLRL